ELEQFLSAGRGGWLSVGHRASLPLKRLFHHRGSGMGARGGGMDPTIRPLGVPGDLGWVVMAHGEEYATEFGWDTTFEALVARIVADYAAAADARSGAWIAERDGQRVGCVFCVPYDDTTAQLRILLVHPSARGHGLGGLLVDSCLDFARGRGFERIRPWTNDVISA